MSVLGPWSHETELPAEASSAARARAFVTDVLRNHELGHVVDDVELAVSELATNALVHAGTRFTVIVSAFEDTVFLEVLDGSQHGPNPGVSLASDTSGRGITVVQAVSRDWGVIERGSDGKSVWAAFDAVPVVPPALQV
ncbi:ATP-binding protein [Nocardioides sp. W7]|uniref:ATP-binding protein n=1 Tax=Nocardioides sp. W7 TaxID=2931390 RepID=UPI001FD2E0B7|nr:ATP-binding protein [Nocardioides sp. W7]